MHGRILEALELLKDNEFDLFIWYLTEPNNVEGLEPLEVSALQNTDNMCVVDLIVQKYHGRETQLMLSVLLKVNRIDLAKTFGNIPPGPVAAVSGPVAAASGQSVSGSRNRRDLLKYVCELTLDPNTTYRGLSLSENNREVMYVEEDQEYPPHPHRFKDMPQVMCGEALTGRCYCEVQCSGDVTVALTHRDINTQGDDSGFGSNNKSWSLNCDGVAKSYTVRHNKEDTVLPVRPSSSKRVAVYLDHAAGTVSFYTVSSDTLTHLHTFQATFTEPLHVGFGCYYDSSVSL